MTDDFDPYLHWLGIRDPQRPPNFYRLLGVELFEQDPIILTNAADRQMAHVRNFQTGSRAAESQRILNELAAAKLCLLNQSRKAEYDAWLRSEIAAAPSTPTPAAAPLPEYRGAAVAEPTPASREPKPLVAEPNPPAVKAAIVVLSALVLLLIGLIVWVSSRKAPPVEVPAGPVAVDDSKEISPTVPSEKPPEPAKPEEPPEPAEKPEAKPPDGPAPTPPAEPADPQAKPQPAEAQPKPSEKIEKIRSAADGIRLARAAIRQRDLTSAAAALGKAEQVSAAEDRPEIDRLREALGPLGAFYRAVHDGLIDLKPGDPLEAGGRQVTVVGATETGLTIQDGRKERQYTVASLPGDLALAVGERGLGDLPSSILAKAAFATFEPGVDRNLARQLCEQAKRDGLPTAALMAELDQANVAAKEPPGPKSKTKDPKRLPVPDAAEQAAALVEVRKIHRDDLDKAVDRTRRNKLAKSLFKEAMETVDAPVVRYVLLSQARDLAIAAGEPDLLREVVVETSVYHQIDASAELVKIYIDLAESRIGSGGKKELSKGALDLAEELLAEDDYETALRLARAAHTMALARDTATAKQATELLRTLQNLKLHHDRFQQAEKILAGDPNNPAAHLAQGRFYCFAKNTPESWEKGLPMLAKGSDAKLKALAEAELAVDAKSDPGDLFNLAEQWYEASKTADETTRQSYRGRAIHWYQKALPDLQGFTQKKAKLRLDELQPAEE